MSKQINVLELLWLAERSGDVNPYRLQVFKGMYCVGCGLANQTISSVEGLKLLDPFDIKPPERPDRVFDRSRLEIAVAVAEAGFELTRWCESTGCHRTRQTPAVETCYALSFSEAEQLMAEHCDLSVMMAYLEARATLLGLLVPLTEQLAVLTSDRCGIVLSGPVSYMEEAGDIFVGLNDTPTRPVLPIVRELFDSLELDLEGEWGSDERLPRSAV